MSWRPKDWYKDHPGSGKPVYEAGADAMYEAMLELLLAIGCKPIADDIRIFAGLPEEEAILARQAIDDDVAEQIEDLQIGGS